ncbi:unnamed protein product [Blepharisma stoltei]|uniref:PPM-type phosphatase domain-containing protein n=1 Tax=Blepharisma stoltei TaxID=1481888 RepID=A0AAU9KJ13_9CILI|nr:unnamed protein product [Blepharisma stoltei]
MFSEVCVTAPSKKKILKLNIKKINTTCPKKKLPKKIEEKPWKDQQTHGEFFSISAKKGPFRQRMEDTFSILHDPSKPFIGFGVFDGHSGIQAAVYASQHLLTKIRSFEESSLIQAFLETDRCFCESAQTLKDGTTATVAMIENGKILVGNVGDSRAILISESSCELLTKDHVASDLEEQARIEKAGGYVIPVGRIPRVQGTMAITRSIGDQGFKQFLIAEPHVIQREIKESDLFLVLASDGIFNNWDIDGLGNFLRERKDVKIELLAEAVAEFAISSGSRDNVTAIIIDLQYFKNPRLKARLLDIDMESDEEDTTMNIETTPKFVSKKFMF